MRRKTRINDEYGQSVDESSNALSVTELEEAAEHVAESIKTGGTPDVMNSPEVLYTTKSGSSDTLSDEVTPTLNQETTKSKAGLSAGFWFLIVGYVLFKILSK